MHFVTFVVVPRDTTRENAEEAVEIMMAPYDENLDVEPYRDDVEPKEIEYYDDVQIDENGQAYRMATYNPNGVWDWWQVGGRWTGYLTDYDPEKDPANQETCNLCDGTGNRTDAAANEWRAKGEHGWEPGKRYCNGCDGKGTRVAWPTQWGPHEGDVVAIERFLDDRACPMPYSFLVPDRGFLKYEVRNPDFVGFDQEGMAGAWRIVHPEIPDYGGKPCPWWGSVLAERVMANGGSGDRKNIDEIWQTMSAPQRDDVLAEVRRRDFEINDSWRLIVAKELEHLRGKANLVVVDYHS